MVREWLAAPHGASVSDDCETATTSRGSRVATGAVGLWSLVLSLLLLWPQGRAGYGLGHDMVFTPQQPLVAATLGASSAAPRAVPVDALVAVLEHAVGGAVLGRLALLLPLLAAGVGCGLLVRRAGLVAALAASGFAVWNPYVVERLAIGQWALLWGYAALPWIVGVGDRVRRRAVAPVALIPPVALASITPTGGVIATAVAVAIVGMAGRRGAAVAAVSLTLQLPWLVGAIVSTARTESGADAVAAFATRGQGPAGQGFAGAVLSALTGGGTWNHDVVPRSQTGILMVVAVLVTCAAVVFGWAGAQRHVPRGRLAALAAGSLVVALATALPGIGVAVTGVLDAVPGGGLLRDGQKWLAPFVVFVVLLVGSAAGRLASAARSGWAVAVLVAALAVPLVLLPDGSAAVRATLTPVRYPAGWQAVARIVRSGGDVAVLPFQPYRRFSWAGGRVSLDPAPRLLPGTTVVDDTLIARGRVVPGEDARAAAVAAALQPARDLVGGLRAAGVRWVLVERGTPGAVPDLRALARVYGDRDLVLYRVSGPVRSWKPATARVVAAAAAHLVWLAVLLGGVAVMAAGAVRRVPGCAHSGQGWAGGRSCAR